VAFQQRKRTAVPYGHGIKLKKAITVNRPANELYRHWRNIESLPNLIDNLEAVEVEDATHSCWKISLPGGLSLSWQAEITVDREDDMIGWRSLPGSDIDMAGSIRFEPVAQGCLVHVALQYNPPAGKLGAVVASIVGNRPGGLVEKTLRRFKQLMETGAFGEFVTGEQKKTSRVRRGDAPRAASVQAASEDSFPASDPPAWTGTTGNSPS